MIEVNPETACVLYLAFAIFVILGAWLISNHKSKSKESHKNPFDSTACEFCQYTYLKDPTKPFSRCPQCGNMNKSSR